jgi:hypothetical protein
LHPLFFSVSNSVIYWLWAKSFFSTSFTISWKLELIKWSLITVNKEKKRVAGWRMGSVCGGVCMCTIV